MTRRIGWMVVVAGLGIAVGSARAVDPRGAAKNPFQNAEGQCRFDELAAWQYEDKIGKAYRLIDNVPPKFEQIQERVRELCDELEGCHAIEWEFAKDEAATAGEIDSQKPKIMHRAIKAMDDWHGKVEGHQNEVRAWSSEDLALEHIEGNPKQAMDNCWGFTEDIKKAIQDHKGRLQRASDDIKAGVSEEYAGEHRSTAIQEAQRELRRLSDELGRERENLIKGRNQVTRCKMFFTRALCFDKKDAYERMPKPAGAEGPELSKQGAVPGEEAPPAAPVFDPNDPSTARVIKPGDQIGYIAQEICGAGNQGNPACANIWDPQNGMVAHLHNSIHNKASPDPTAIYSGTTIDLTELRKATGIQ